MKVFFLYIGNARRSRRHGYIHVQMLREIVKKIYYIKFWPSETKCNLGWDLKLTFYYYVKTGIYENEDFIKVYFIHFF